MKLAFAAFAAAIVGCVLGWLGAVSQTMDRGVGMTSAAAVKPVTWRVHTAFPRMLPVGGTAAPAVAERIKVASGGAVSLQVFDPGKLVPALEYYDAVQKGALDAAYGMSMYYSGKIPAAVFFSAVPFGPEMPQLLAWMDAGGGKELLDELMAPRGLKAIPCGLVPPEASGWFRRPIEKPSDLEGVRMRISGLGAKVLEKLGVATQLIAPGDVFPALERGTVDAAEFSVPAVDLKLGLYQAAEHYYFPGWHQTASLMELLIHRPRWDALSPAQQATIESACKAQILSNLAVDNSAQADALAEIEAKGIQIHRWSPEVLARMREAWAEVVDEEAAKDADFARVRRSLETFLEKNRRWWELSAL